MGGCDSKSRGTPEERAISSKISSDLRKEKERQQTIKLLLLGAGESGKSTFAKQMKIIHLNGYKTPEDRKRFINVVHQNILDNVKSLLEAAEKFEKPLREENKPLIKKIITITEDDMQEMENKGMSAELRDAIKALWNDPAIQSTFFKSSEYQLNDSAEYFFKALDRIATPDYIPLVDDILRVRAKTTGINEIEFKVNRYNFQMVDVGGQRSERRKWIHCFQDVTAIIFCAASSEYDQKLYEDESTNRMMEALKLFKDITNSKWFRNTPIMLFLNKDDLFRAKIQKVPLNVCFKNYTGDNSYDDAIGYIEDQFLAQIANPNKLVYSYKTTATDTDNITRIFQTVKNIFITAFLTQMGLGIPGPTAASYIKSSSSSNNSTSKVQAAAAESPTRVDSRKSLPGKDKATDSANGGAKDKRKDSSANSNETTSEKELGSSTENSPTERRASIDVPKRKNSNAKKKKKAGDSNGKTEAAHLKEVNAQ